MMTTACCKYIRKAMVTAIVLSLTLLWAVWAPGLRGAGRGRRATWPRLLIWLVELIEILKHYS